MVDTPRVKRTLAESPTNAQQELRKPFNAESAASHDDNNDEHNAVKSSELECDCDARVRGTCPTCKKQTRWARVLKKLRWVCRGLTTQDASFLFPEHWLEAIDAKHRVGSGLNHYFSSWLRSDTTQVFVVIVCVRLVIVLVACSLLGCIDYSRDSYGRWFPAFLRQGANYAVHVSIGSFAGFLHMDRPRRRIYVGSTALPTGKARD